MLLGVILFYILNNGVSYSPEPNNCFTMKTDSFVHDGFIHPN